MRPPVLFGLLVVFSALSFHAIPMPAQEPLDVVPLEYRQPTLVVKARINGSDPLVVAFDTGTTTILIDTQVARRLGLQAVPRPGRTGPGFARARTVAVGRAVAHDLELVIRDLSPLSERMGVKLAGILGFTWMENFVFRIDYRAGRLTLWPRPTQLVPEADELPLPLELHTRPNFSGASVHVPARLEGRHRCPMMVDTGTDKGVLGRKIAARLGVTLRPVQSAQENKGLPVHTVRRLEFAGRIFTNVRFLFDPRRGAEANPYEQCVIGNEQLRHFVVTLDIPHRRAFFRPLPPLPEPE